MDFSLTDEQRELQTLANQILSGERASWKELASAGLLGVAIPVEYGGLGFGIFELCLLLEEQGRAAVDLPLLPTLVTALCLPEDAKAEWLPKVVAGDAVLTAALEELVPYAVEADAILIGEELV